MNLNQIEAFLVLSECLSVTETAQRLFCTQPSISIKIRKLEEDLKTVLFERVNNRLFLTPQGTIFKQYAIQIMNLIKASREHVKQFDNPLHGTIKFGASNFAGVYLLPKIMAIYKKEAPTVNLSMDISTSSQLIHKLESQELEFLIMSDHIYIDAEKYKLDTFLTDPLVVICSPSHRLAKIGHCQFSDIESETFLIKPEHSATRDFILSRLEEEHKTLRNVMEISSLEGIKQGVIHGLGISIVSKLAVLHEIRAGVLCEIGLDDMTFSRGIRYVHHKDKYISPATRNFLSVLTKQSNM